MIEWQEFVVSSKSTIDRTFGVLLAIFGPNNFNFPYHMTRVSLLSEQLRYCFMIATENFDSYNILYDGERWAYSEHAIFKYTTADKLVIDTHVRNYLNNMVTVVKMVNDHCWVVSNIDDPASKCCFAIHYNNECDCVIYDGDRVSLAYEYCGRYRTHRVHGVIGPTADDITTADWIIRQYINYVVGK